ncbi:hypothetical protein M378DRAFT_180091 [Amanita muscaria Koide BX008]|uniref:Uncharacterized protein n=1 Tax=Amanita muscaria (strain Koide BX008) TaxID=946122 RepID=A0A0C2SE68_AMAMK|nr:hypothetical protein M378DRAFT_180091 [Amanita muscaria Koide BX008]
MTLLSEEYIIFGVLETRTVPSLVVVDFVSGPPEPQRLCDVKHAFTFYFPPFAQKASIIDVDVRSDPSPSWAPNSELPVPFFTSRHHRIYVITILVAPNGIMIEPKTLQFFALGKFFISLTRKFADQVPAYIDWPAWGPKGTRMLVFPYRVEWFTRYVYGSRYVTTNGRVGLGDEHVYIYEFNQTMVRWKKRNITNDTTSADTGTTTESAEDPTKADNLKSAQRCVIVTAPSRFADREIFQVEVETKLGYCMTLWEIPQEWRPRSVMCSEDGIVIVVSQQVRGKCNRPLIRST